MKMEARKEKLVLLVCIQAHYTCVQGRVDVCKCTWYQRPTFGILPQLLAVFVVRQRFSSAWNSTNRLS